MKNRIGLIALLLLAPVQDQLMSAPLPGSVDQPPVIQVFEPDAYDASIRETPYIRWNLSAPVDALKLVIDDIIVDCVAYLGVSVYTNSEVKVEGEGEGWGVATNGVIEVPAPGKQGFFILKSKGVTK